MEEISRMKVIVVDNIHLYKDECGNYYAPSIYSYDFFLRYLKVFDSVKVIAKVKDEVFDKEKCNLVSGPGIEIIALPWYQGFRQMISKLPKLISIYRNVGQDADCYIYRIAQVESFFAFFFSFGLKKPFAVEVVNDPDTFVDINFFMRKFSVAMVKFMCKRANGASYVTKCFLQEKYPTGKKGKKEKFESYYSSVSLEDKDIISTPKKFNNDCFNIIHVSNAINSDIKGHTTLINVGKYLSEKNINYHISFVGDGGLLEEYKELVRKQGLEEKISFLGRISNKDHLFSILRDSDLMVLPTQMEGLPRTIIEAMANGLPCLSTPIAGIPELLEKQYLFDPFDVTGFGEKIIYLTNNRKELEVMSKKNLQVSQSYRKSVLEERRTIFYQQLYNCCEK